MERRLKERLTGAAVLVMLAVIFIPMILDNSSNTVDRITDTNIPPRPETDFRSRIASPQIDPNIEDTQGFQNSPESPTRESATEETQSTTTMVVPQDRSPSSSGSGAEVAANVSQQTDDEDSGDGEAWVVQLGSFSSQSNASSLVAELQGQGYRAYIEEIKGDSGIIYRVRVGPELSKSNAENTLAGLAEKYQLQGMILRYP